MADGAHCLDLGLCSPWGAGGRVSLLLVQDEWGWVRTMERSLGCHRGSPVPGESSGIREAPGARESRELSSKRVSGTREASDRPDGCDSVVFPDSGRL